jgi:tetratricopeptide (TPR) repeat protein
MRRIVIGLFAFLLLGTPAVAQHESHGAASAEQLGTVHFETSCSPDVRRAFDRAVALLHSFEFRFALDAFKAVLAKDQTCAIAQWGIALSYWGNPFAGARTAEALKQGSAAVDQGRSTARATPRERAYIEAVGALFDDHARKSQRERVVAYEKAMAALTTSFPEDTEATIFYALAVNQTALPSDKSYVQQLKAASLLEPLYERQPDHPGLAHYIIHAYDHPPLAPKALGAARRYARIAPSAAHALHMPSHTFTRVGHWRESVEANRASEQTALKHGVMGEALHAMDYQAYAYLQMAQDRAAQAVLERLPAVVAKFDPDAIGGAAPGMAGLFAISAIPARYALERGAWDAAAQLEVPKTGPPFTIAIAHFARGLGAARSGNPAEARIARDRLVALHGTLTDMQDAYWAEQVDIQRRIVDAWIAFAGAPDGDRRASRPTSVGETRPPVQGTQHAIQLLRDAADAEDATDKAAVTPGPLAPARELLGEMLLEAARPKDALIEFEASMAKEPGRFRGLYGAAQAAEAAGQRDKAHEYYRKLLDVAAAADSSRAELQRARKFVKAP